MGNNPTRSQKLQGLFTDYKFMSQLTSHQSNIFQLIFVRKQEKIFAIKQLPITYLKKKSDNNHLCSQNNNPLNMFLESHCYKHSNILNLIDNQECDNNLYLLYQWVPQTIEDYFRGNIYRQNLTTIKKKILGSCLQAYIFIYKKIKDQWPQGINFFEFNLSYHIRIQQKSSSDIRVVIIPPQMMIKSKNTSSDSKKTMSNKLNNLTKLLLRIFYSDNSHALENRNESIYEFLKKMEKMSDEIQNWEKMLNDLQIIGQQSKSIKKSPRRMSFHSRKNSQNISQQFHPNPLKSPQPDLLNRTKSPRPITPLNQNSPARLHTPSRVHTPSKFTVPDNSSHKILHQYSKNLASHQIIPENNTKKIYVSSHHREVPKNQLNLRKFPTQTNFQQAGLFNQNRNNIQAKPFLQTSQIYQTQTFSDFNKVIFPTNNQISSKFFQPNINLQSRKTIHHTNTKLDKMTPINSALNKGTYQGYPNRKQSVQINSPNKKVFQKFQYKKIVPSGLEKQASKSKFSPKNMNPEDWKASNQTYEKIFQFIHRKDVGKNETNIKSKQKTETEIIEPITLIFFPMFEPSPRDPVQLKPKIGIPDINYVSKTKSDIHKKEEDQEKLISLKTSKKTNENQRETNFASSHLLFKKNQNNSSEKKQRLNEKEILISNNESKSIFGSGIPFSCDQDSLKLAFSEDSEQIDLHGQYHGDYHQSFVQMKHGNGTLTFPSGGSYRGQFSYNKMDGFGKLFYPSGLLAYEGYWHKNKFDGYGKLFNEFPEYIQRFDCRDFNFIQKIPYGLQPGSNGYWKVFEGNMKNDMKDGSGVWILQNGQKYEGQFWKDYVHGDGIFYGKDGVISGRWENNILVEIYRNDKP